MTNVTTLKNQFLNNEHDSTLTDLYYDDLEMIKYQKERYVNALDKYIGISNTRIQNIVNIESDFYLHYYAFGIIGSIILLIIY